MPSIGRGAEIASTPGRDESGWAPNFDVCRNRMLNNISEMTNLSASTCSGTPAHHSSTLSPTDMVVEYRGDFAQVPFRGALPLPYRCPTVALPQCASLGLWTLDVLLCFAQTLIYWPSCRLVLVSEEHSTSTSARRHAAPRAYIPC